MTLTPKPPIPPKAARIRQAIADSGRTPAEVARLLGRNRQAIQGWMTTGRVDKEELLRLANLVNHSLEWLITGEGHPKAIPMRPRLRLPLLAWADLASSAGPTEGEMTIETSATAGPGSFGLPIDGDWMQGEMPQGSVAIIDPTRQPKAGDYVLALVNGRHVLRQYLTEGDAVVLKARHPDYPPIIAAVDAVTIKGVVVRVEKDY